jgi:hypothetical protein
VQRQRYRREATLKTKKITTPHGATTLAINTNPQR